MPFSDTAKKQIADGTDPSITRKIEKAGAVENTFQAIALEWYEKNIIHKSESHQKRTLRLLNADLFSWLGSRPIAELKALELLAALRRMGFAKEAMT